MGDAGSPLDSPALGSGLEALVRPCAKGAAPADPGRVPDGPTLGVTLSGGGFRATLAALGVVRFLADTGRLADVRYVSSVSGGSVANAVLAARWAELRREGFTSAAVDRLVVDPVVAAVAGSSLKWELARNLWRAVGPRTRTDVLAMLVDRHFLGGRNQPLSGIDPQCRFIINAANLTTGVRFSFEREVIGDYVLGLIPTAPTGITLSTAVAASAAVPGAFAPLRLRHLDFPCPGAGDPQLVDGGAYDNTGLEALDGDQFQDVFLVALDAGGTFVTGRLGSIPVVRELARANALLYRQSTGLRERWMVDRFQAWAQPTAGSRPPYARDGLLFRLASDFTSAGAGEWRALHPELRTWNGVDLAFVPTVFDRLDPRLCRLLVYRGWWITGAAFAQYEPGMVTLPRSAPVLS